jgi:hypothetical protein
MEEVMPVPNRLTFRRPDKKHAHVRNGKPEWPSLREMDRRVPFLPPDVPKNDWV